MFCLSRAQLVRYPLESVLLIYIKSFSAYDIFHSRLISKHIWFYKRLLKSKIQFTRRAVLLSSPINILCLSCV